MKESVAFSILEKSGGPAIAHDDRLLIRGQKHEIGLEADWREMTDIRHRNGEPVIVNYVLPGIKHGDPPRDILDPDRWAALDTPAKIFYRPQYLRGLDLGGGASISIKNNQFDLMLTNLFGNLGSRYRSALEAMVNLTARGVIKYRPRADEPTERNRQEAIRNRLRRTTKPTEYEHDLLFAGDLGRAIYRDLWESDKVAEKIPGTVYVKGFQKYKGIAAATKVYDIGVREGEAGGEYFKLETTLYKAFFKAEGIGVRELTEQPAIQERMIERLYVDLAAVVKLLSGETMAMLQAELDLTGSRDEKRRHQTIARALLDRRQTLTERVSAIERTQAEHERRIAALERQRSR